MFDKNADLLSLHAACQRFRHDEGEKYENCMVFILNGNSEYDA